MKEINQFCLLGCCLFISAWLHAQGLVNRGQITIMPGGLLTVEGDFINPERTSLELQGELEVSGDLTNEGIVESSPGSTLRFLGSTTSFINCPDCSFYQLSVEKDDGNVSLGGGLEIAEALVLEEGLLLLGDHTLSVTSDGMITGGSSSSYLVALEDGYVRKGINQAESWNVPLGDLMHFTPISLEISGSQFDQADVRVRLRSSPHPNLQDDTDAYIRRYWRVEQSGISDYQVQWTANYVESDIEGDVSAIRGATFLGDSETWEYRASDAAFGQVMGLSTEDVSGFSGTNFYGRLAFRVFLEGPYSTSTGQMNTALNSGGWLPTTSPYTQAPAEVSPDFFQANPNIVDWILIELRNPATPSQVLQRQSAFLLSDGHIIGLDGQQLPALKNSVPEAIVSVDHRNHLPFRTAEAIDLRHPSVVLDFSQAQPNLFVNPANIFNAPLRQLSDGVFALWGGDAIGTNNAINSTDFSNVRNQTTPAQVGYLRADINMNGAANSTDFARARLASTPAKSAHL